MGTKNEERAGFEEWLGIKPCGAAHDLAAKAFQAGAAWQRAQGAVPEGWRLVPVEPTHEMRQRAQGYLAAEGVIVSDWLINTAYRELLAAAPSTPAAQVAVPEVSAMARVLSDRSADACNIDRDDNWKIYGQEFIEDVRAMLAASTEQEVKK